VSEAAAPTATKEAGATEEAGAQPPPAGLLRDWLEQMLVIRQFEAESVRLSLTGQIPGGIHSSAGQEGVAVGVAQALGPDDVVSGTHRSHHHALAKGLTPREVMAELFGKADGCAGGRGGSMHLVDIGRHFLGSNGIVGAGLGLAMGAALAMKMRSLPAVAVGYFGDGGANTGRVWEFINLAALWKLPLIAVCENNLYAVETHISQAMAGETVAARASGFGLPAEIVDGQDVLAVYHAVRQARSRALAGQGPTFIEALTYRYEGHNVGDVQNYREKSEVADWLESRDPIERLRQQLAGWGQLDEAGFMAATSRAAAAVADAIAFAESSPWPDPASVDRAWPDQDSSAATVVGRP
jgi:TPP-dependent pyruvate/acetoin dehydrogenase alpha subunit